MKWPTDVPRRAAWSAHALVRGIAMLLALTVSIGLWAVPAQAQFIRDAEIERTLNDYARPIFEAAGLGSQRIKMRIIRDKAFNAFVLDGRNVFMNTGTLMQSETPNEIIGIIAHETGHIAGGHLAGLRTKVKQDMSRSLLMKILGIGAMVAGAATGTEGLKEGGLTATTSSDAVALRSILSYRRVQESSADQAAIAYLEATGQSARGMLVTFERFAQQELLSDRFKDPYVQSHPGGQERLNQLTNLAQQSQHFSATDSAELQLRHELMKAKLAGFLENPRQVLNRYPASDKSLPAVYARAIALFHQSGVEAAMPLIDQLIETQPNYAYFWELKGDLLLRKGDNVNALAPLQKARKLAPDEPLIQLRLADAMIGSGNRDLAAQAVDLLRKALVQESDNSTAYRQLANAYYQRGDEGLAYLATAEASLREGKIADAKGFAKRSQPLFKQGSPSWLRADDIINLKSEAN